jgi:hypothetical protein
MTPGIFSAGDDNSFKEAAKPGKEATFYRFGAE